MVPHFKLVHENDEVFVSRISQKMVDRIKKNELTFVKYKRKTVMCMTATCVFCDGDIEHVSSYWPTHIRMHTGEYVNECKVCDKMVNYSTHCGFPTDRKHTFDLKRQDFNAYLCNICNFLQIDRQNMENHLKNMHGPHDIDANMSVITLLPALDRLQLGINSNLGK